MRYWLTVGDGKTLGPYTLEELRSFAASGRLGPGAQVCQEGSTTWGPVSAVLGPAMPPQQMMAPPQPMAAPVQPTMAPGVQYAGGGGVWVPKSLVGPIFCTLCCCLPGGILALVYTSGANTKGAAGDIAGAQSDAKNADVWMIVSVVVGGLTSVVAFLSGALG